MGLAFPVNFQSLEDELTPMCKYMQGKVLNAGCGNRDITDFLKSGGAVEVENCDIASDIPGAIICELTSIPVDAGTYDAILCNAVLEHVPDPVDSMKEFKRLLSKDGYAVISIPFLQPYHPTPTDFRRYTREGLVQLAGQSGFDVVEIRAVHSLAQTVGWIVWRRLEESGNKLGKLLSWLPIYILTKMFQQSKVDTYFAANSFQVVMQRKE
ncbi:MAG: class I SAM-dependent methyltransferase [Mariprofundaceae bacterium]